MVSIPNYCSSGLPGVLIESVRNVHVDSLTLVGNCLTVGELWESSSSPKSGSEEGCMLRGERVWQPRECLKYFNQQGEERNQYFNLKKNKINLLHFFFPCGQQPLKRRERYPNLSGTLGWDGAAIPVGGWFPHSFQF